MALAAVLSCGLYPDCVYRFLAIYFVLHYFCDRCRHHYLSTINHEINAVFRLYNILLLVCRLPYSLPYGLQGQLDLLWHGLFGCKLTAGSSHGTTTVGNLGFRVFLIALFLFHLMAASVYASINSDCGLSRSIYRHPVFHQSAIRLPFSPSSLHCLPYAYWYGFIPGQCYVSVVIVAIVAASMGLTHIRIVRNLFLLLCSLAGLT